jgi:hypothetical protein
MIALLVLLGVWMFILGRQRTVVMRNESIDKQGITYEAVQVVGVSFDEAAETEITYDDAAIFYLVGSSHKLKLRVADEDGNTLRVVEKTIKLDLSKNISVDIPELLEKKEEEVKLTGKMW